VPPQSSYAAELSQAFWRAVGEMMARTGAMLHLSHEALVWIASLLVVLALVALGWLLFSVLRRRRSRREEAADAVSALAPAAAAWDAAAWRAELERCLAEERIGEALRAAWWWLARTIAGPEAEADWTSRDLAVRTRRRELRDLLRRLDILTFGADRPGVTDVRRLAEQIDGALVGEAG
jgi:hypothetical protein